MAELDSRDRMILDNDGLEDFRLPWPEPKTETALQKLPVSDALPKVEPRNVPTVLEIGLTDPDAGSFL